MCFEGRTNTGMCRVCMGWVFPPRLRPAACLSLQRSGLHAHAGLAFLLPCMHPVPPAHPRMTHPSMLVSLLNDRSSTRRLGTVSRLWICTMFLPCRFTLMALVRSVSPDASRWGGVGAGAATGAIGVAMLALVHQHWHAGPCTQLRCPPPLTAPKPYQLLERNDCRLAEDPAEAGTSIVGLVVRALNEGILGWLVVWHFSYRLACIHKRMMERLYGHLRS